MPSSRASTTAREQPDEDAEPERAGPRSATDDGEGVAADGHEAGLAEVEQAGVAEVHVEADGGEAVHRGDRAEALLQASG